MQMENMGIPKLKKVITPERFEEWNNYLLDNLYIQVGDELLRQIVGIPMGVSCAPYLANVMLFMYELEFFDDFISTHDPICNKPANCYGTVSYTHLTLPTILLV